MGLPMKGHSITIKYKLVIIKMENTYEMINDNTSANGRIIRCMERENFSGLMVVNILESIKKIKKMDQVYSPGLLKNKTKINSKFILDNGKKASNKVSDTIKTTKMFEKSVTGIKGKEKVVGMMITIQNN